MAMILSSSADFPGMDILLLSLVSIRTMRDGGEAAMVIRFMIRSFPLLCHW
jgi:hypothetical protein